MESERESDSEKGERAEIDDGWHQHRPRTVIENWSDLTERRVKKREEDFFQRAEGPLLQQWQLTPYIIDLSVHVLPLD